MLITRDFLCTLIIKAAKDGEERKPAGSQQIITNFQFFSSNPACYSFIALILATA